MQGLSNDFKQFFPFKNSLLTSVHNDTDDTNGADDIDAADNTDDTDNYNRVIGRALLKAFSCDKNKVSSLPNLHHLQGNELDTITIEIIYSLCLG